jgi:hypothetical protein
MGVSRNVNETRTEGLPRLQIAMRGFSTGEEKVIVLIPV